MVKSCTFEHFNLSLVDFDSLLQSIEVSFIDDLSKYSLLHSKKINRDIKKLLYHHIFYGISEYILNCKSRERIVILKKTDGILPKELLLMQYFDEKELLNRIDQVVSRVARLLPVCIYGYDKFNFTNLRRLYDEREGNVVELIERIRMFNANHSAVRSVYTFAKIRSFAKRNGLLFLSEKYFNQLKTKQLLLA